MFVDRKKADKTLSEGLEQPLTFYVFKIYPSAAFDLKTTESLFKFLVGLAAFVDPMYEFSNTLNSEYPYLLKETKGISLLEFYLR